MAVPARFGNEFRVNTITTGDQDSGSVAALANGKFVVVWEDASSSGFNNVMGQIYNADGSKFGGVSEMTIAGGVGDQQRPVVTGTGDGRFVVAWEDYFSGPSDISARVYNADGTSPSGTYQNEFLANSDTTRAQTEPAIAAFTSNPANGRFLVSFTTLRPPADGGDTDINARAYNAAGAFSPDAFPVDNLFRMTASRPSPASRMPMEIMSSSGRISTLASPPTAPARTSARRFSPATASRSPARTSSSSTPLLSASNPNPRSPASATAPSSWSLPRQRPEIPTFTFVASKPTARRWTSSIE